MRRVSRIVGITGLLLFALTRTPAPAAETKEQSKDKEKAQAAVVAVFPFEGPITEKPAADDPLFGSLHSESLQSLITRMDKAAEDDKVEAVVLLLGHTSFGDAQTTEIREAVDRIKAAGKPVHAHADSLQTNTYKLLCGASDLSVSPTGDLWITGLYGEQLYLKGLFDLLGVQPDFLTCGDYKSAGEMFTRTGPSPEAEEMYKWLYDSLFEATVDLIARGREVDADQARKWIDEGLYSAESAKEAGLIDAVEHRQEFVARLKEQHGGDVQFDKSYGKKKGPEIDFNNPFAAFQLWAQILSGPQTRKSTKDAVAIVYVDGPIMLGSAEASLFGAVEGAYSDPIRKALDETAADDRVKAVVLRVDSPGGSAVASEIILNACQRVQEKKPVVVSMGNVAASGGYYVACGSNRIFADANTITGSIGVVAGKLATTNMWKRIGVNFHPIQRGKRSGMMSSAGTFSEEEKEELQGWMDDVYEVFKKHVETARKDRLKKPIDELAGGRVYSGRQAFDLGLVDELGTLNDAVAYVAKEAKVEDYEIRSVPKAKNFLEELMGELAGASDSDKKDLQSQGVLSSSLFEAALPMLQGMDPHRVSLVRRALQQLDIVHQERVMLTMPVIDLRD